MIYRKNRLKEIIFPLGGIGTGSIGLAGNGALVDWEIFNRPNKGSINGYSCFAVTAEYPDGKRVVKILQGDHMKDFSGNYAVGYGSGAYRRTMCGFPHFRKLTFDGKFPIATLTFEDEDFPAKVIMTAFNPFIPLDSDRSSIPAAFFDIKLKSLKNGIKYTVVLSVNNPFSASENRLTQDGKYTAIQLLHHGKSPDTKEYGDMTVAVRGENSFSQEYWYRGKWQDQVTTFWRELADGTLGDRHYEEPGKNDMCSVGADTLLGKNQTQAFRFVISWNIPNCFNYWNPCTDGSGNDILWKNYYATLFKDSTETCFYCFDHWDLLYRKTARFCRSLHSATLDKSVIDAVSATLSVLKSPTVMRLEDGTFYGWEGVFEREGACEGTCTHVWSYAYALCFLFPDLERSLRDTEFRYDTDPYGSMQFRTALPLGRSHTINLPCLDGQMATVIKIYRDWKLTGNSKWLKDNYPHIQKILEYAWSPHNEYQWDRNKDGVLEGRQHHTLDMELFGPSSWLQGMYLGALKAAAEMAAFLGDRAKAEEYAGIFENGCRWTKENLFNGSYFCQQITLTDKTCTEDFACPAYWNEEKGELKYQIGEGCEIDQLLGQWHANICGLGDIFDKTQRQTALRSMLRNNFKKPLRDFANMWRVFALNDESGTVMCDYPTGVHKPVIPLPYADECMTGFEYAFAGLLISEGFAEEGIQIVRAIRDRYDGEKRNPWNEIECGSNYARAMASFALLPIFSGFEFDVPKKHIGFSPVLSGDFQCMWNLGCGWGDFKRKNGKYTVCIADGCLELESITLGGLGFTKTLRIDRKPVPFIQRENTLFFETTTVRKDIIIEVSA